MAEVTNLHDALEAIATKSGVRLAFPPDLSLPQSAETEDASLTDLRRLPFVTIDNEDTQDMDQALYLEALPDGGIRVFYALADASYFVRPGSDLLREAEARGLSYYLPGKVYPMLPPVLSEDLVSLRPHVDRRALVLVVDVDAEGEVKPGSYQSAGTQGQTGRLRLDLAVIHSQGKLNYAEVSRYYEAPEGHPYSGQNYSESLRLLAVFGRLRMAEAKRRGVPDYHRMETQIALDPDDPGRLKLVVRDRVLAERYNEQLSLLINSEGAAFMVEAGRAPQITPIYKVHPKPEASRLNDYARFVRGLQKTHKLPDDPWAWKRESGQRLADYLDGLPLTGPKANLSRALHHQAILVNQRSEFSAKPGLHHGVGADPYARFSAPMRELVGLFTHHEAIEKIRGETRRAWKGGPQLEQTSVVRIANRAMERQKVITRRVTELYMDGLLGPELAREASERTVYTGLILGMNRDKIYVRFEEPQLEIKLYIKDLNAQMGANYQSSEHGARTRDKGPSRAPTLSAGTTLRLRVSDYDKSRARYLFAVLSPETNL